MSYIVIQENLDGKVVDWLEHVSDDQYSSGQHNPQMKKAGIFRPSLEMGNYLWLYWRNAFIFLI